MAKRVTPKKQLEKKKAAKKQASIYTAFRIAPDLRRKAEEQAKKEGRTLSNYIKQLIREDVAGTENFPTAHSTEEPDSDYQSRK